MLVCEHVSVCVAVACVEQDLVARSHKAVREAEILYRHRSDLWAAWPSLNQQISF